MSINDKYIFDIAHATIVAHYVESTDKNETIFRSKTQSGHPSLWRLSKSAVYYREYAEHTVARLDGKVASGSN